MKNTPKNAGNAFVLILIIIALLGALTAVMTRMGNNVQDMSQDKATTIASQVLRQGRTVATGVDGLINKGCSYTQLSFENLNVTGYTNAQSPADKSCWVFDPAGAGLLFPTPPSNSNDGSDWAFIRGISVTGVGPERESVTLCADNCQDVMAVLPVMNIDVCKAINLQAGITTSFNTNPPADINAFAFNSKFYAPSSAPSNGNLSGFSTSSGSRLGSSGALGSTALWDKKAACFEAASGYTDMSGTSQAGTGVYFFYQVLYER